MTEFELLELMGDVDEEYIIASKQKPKKRYPVKWLASTAAVLAVVIIGGAVFFSRSGLSFGSGSASAEPAVYESDGESAYIGNHAVMKAEADETADMEIPAEGAISSNGSYRDVVALASAVYPESIAEDDLDAESARWTENQVSSDTAYALNSFSYKTASMLFLDSGSSECYSPLSLYHALAILAGGAEGETRKELLSLMGFSDVDTMAEEIGKLYRVNYNDGDENALMIANSLWLDDTTAQGESVSYEQDWVIDTAADYYADVYEADFSSKDTAQALGNWVAEHTGGMLEPDAQDLGISEDTMMMIMNTLYYKATWQCSFDESNTAEGTFHADDGSDQSASYMNLDYYDGQYIETDTYIKSVLPLSTGKMIVILPKDGVDLDSLLTEDQLWTIYENGNYAYATVHWSMPKFTTEVQYDLTGTLQQLGVADAFSDQADFSDISDTPLKVSTVRQGTKIMVDEGGISAAAYTDVGMELATAINEEPQEVYMTLDRPFMYLITANDGSTLFMGVVRGLE